MLRFFCIGLLLVTTTAATAAVVVTVLPNLGVPLGSEGTYPVDFDGDGFYEVLFTASGGSVFSAKTNSHVRIQSIPEPPPGINSDAWSLQVGAIIGAIPISPASWVSDPIGGTLRSCTDLFCVGYWPTDSYLKFDPVSGFMVIFPESGYLGVEFTNETGVHYGWVDVGVLGFDPSGRIYGWGWETQAGIGVQIVPEPSTALLVAAGILAAVSRRQRKENQEA